MEKDDVIDTLNDLIETCKDGEEGFSTCAEDVGRAELKRILERAAQRCGESAVELQAEVLRLGGKPERKRPLRVQRLRAGLHPAERMVRGRSVSQLPAL